MVAAGRVIVSTGHSGGCAVRYTRLSAAMSKASIVLLVFFLSLSAPASDLPAIQGFSSDSATAERGWESIFKGVPSPERMREYMQRLSARPHHVGTAYDKENAEWILAFCSEAGGAGA